MNNIFADNIIISQAMFKSVSSNELPAPGGVAIKGKYIIAVGDEQKLAKLIGPDTKVYRYGNDSLLMPGICDSHLHLSATIALENGPKLRFVRSEEECVDITKKWYEDHSSSQWILGGGWHFSNWQHKEVPDKKLLSQAFPDVPVCLMDVDFHAAWLNQKALDILSINRDTSDPGGGKIYKDSTGEPSGYLEETPSLTAYQEVSAAIFADSQIRKNYLSNTCRILNRRGITSVMDALDTEDDWYQTMEKMLEENTLGLRINTTVRIIEDEDFIKKGQRLALRYSDREGKIYFWGYKLVADGVGAIRTAWMTDSYADDPHTKGYPLMDPGKMREGIIKAEKIGYGVHIHACGTRAVEFALDTFEEAESLGLIKDQRNSITHLDSINDKDFPRFKALNVTASLQPDMLAPTPGWVQNLYPVRFGEKLMRNSWAIRRIFDNSNVVSFSSDSPVTVAKPMNNIFRATQRLHDDGTPKGGINPEQKVSLSQCLWAYTYGGAYQLGKEDILGTLEVGKLADITVLDRNLFKCEPDDYRKTEALLTMIDGKIVYDKSSNT